MLPDFITRPPPTFPSHVNPRTSTRARRLALRLNTQKRIFDLTIPQGLSLHKAYDFALKNEAWMQAELAKLPKNIPFTNGQTIPLFGRSTRITIEPHPTSSRTYITLKDDILHVQTKLEDPSQRITEFLKAHASAHLSTLTQEKAAQIGKTVKDVKLRDTKSRWGSCSEDGRIMYSWRLIFAPPSALDYVVAHETAHLQHLDHSKQFWALCRSLSSNFLEGSQWMQEHGNSLMRYGE